MVRCVINLENNERAVYFAGEMLKGTIELHLDQPKKFRGLCFTVYGAAKCHWTETRTKTTGSGKNRRTTTQTVHFEGKNVYLNARTYLFGASGATPIEMPSGTHRYDFACQLPPLVPASFEAKHGSIRYNVEAELDIPWSFDKEFKLGFTVVRNDDLNFEPQLKLPCRTEEIKHFCCLFCQSDPLMVMVTLPYSGFTPGQNVHVTVSYNNKSDVDVLQTRICLNRIICYTSSTPHSKNRYEHEKMAEIDCQGVKQGSSVTVGHNLMIPGNMMSSNNNYCNVVRVSYEINVVAVVSGCHSNVEISIPITIGSVPLNFDQTSIHANNITMPFVPVPTTNNLVVASAPVSDQALDLPPSFDEAVKMDAPKVDAPSLKSDTNGLGWNVPEAQMPSAPEK